MRKLKFRDLKRGKLYCDENGEYKFKGMLNDYLAIFDEIFLNEDGKIDTVQKGLYKTENEVGYLEEM